MKQIIHHGYDLTEHVNVEEIDDCVLDNLQAPTIRTGSEPFTSYYSVEWFYDVCHRIDPARSLTRTLLNLFGREYDPRSKWPICDILHCLMSDLGFNIQQPRKYEVVAFWTMIPVGIIQCLAESYWKNTAFFVRHENLFRVINNPFFYKNPGVSEHRLVEIGEMKGFRYAVDRTKIIAEPMVLADEMTMLNESNPDPAKVQMKRNDLSRSIKEILDNNGILTDG
ncbi:MAG: hypothetical protein ACI4QT_04420 [Kiritimatiellia bacterium]